MAEEQNIEKLKKELKRLKDLVLFDYLTGILNRFGFKEEAKKALRAVSFGRAVIERRIGFQIPFSIIFLDIDDFKKINDVFGHEVGDHVLKKVAVILRNRLRDSDIFGRWGGEEFVIALLGTNLAAAEKVAEDLRSEIEQRVIVNMKGKSGKVTISLGVVGYNGEKNLDKLINKADQAMYQAKRHGKNRIVTVE